MFVIEWLYTKFPRLKQRHDSVARLWKELPNDVMLKEINRRSLVNKVFIYILLTVSYIRLPWFIFRTVFSYLPNSYANLYTI